MSIHVQLYAYMTLISENMIENMTFVENNEIFSSQKITYVMWRYIYFWPDEKIIKIMIIDIKYNV